jgi:uncharacterized protein (DUF924 family)
LPKTTVNEEREKAREELALLRRLLVQKETLNKQMAEWLASANQALARNFILDDLAESVLRNEIKFRITRCDPHETAAATIERLITDGVQEHHDQVQD